MQKPFNSLVIYVRNGVALPAVVLRSQLQGDGREFLSLLYADPATGPSLVLAGGTRKVGSVDLSVPPFVNGAAFGWLELPVYPVVAEQLAEHTAAVIAGKPVEPVQFREKHLPGVHGLPDQENESDEEKAARLANLAHQAPVVEIPSSFETKLDDGEIVEATANADGNLIGKPIEPASGAGSLISGEKAQDGEQSDNADSSKSTSESTAS